MIFHHDFDNDITFRLENIQYLIELILTEDKCLLDVKCWIINYLSECLDLPYKRAISLDFSIVVEV